MTSAADQHHGARENERRARTGDVEQALDGDRRAGRRHVQMDRWRRRGGGDARARNPGVEDVGGIHRLDAEPLAGADRFFDLAVVRLDRQPDVDLVYLIVNQQFLELFETSKRLSPQEGTERQLDGVNEADDLVRREEVGAQLSKNPQPLRPGADDDGAPPLAGAAGPACPGPSNQQEPPGRAGAEDEQRGDADRAAPAGQRYDRRDGRHGQRTRQHPPGLVAPSAQPRRVVETHQVKRQRGADRQGGDQHDVFQRDADGEELVQPARHPIEIAADHDRAERRQDDQHVDAGHQCDGGNRSCRRPQRIAGSARNLVDANRFHGSVGAGQGRKTTYVEWIADTWHNVETAQPVPAFRAVDIRLPESETFDCSAPCPARELRRRGAPRPPRAATAAASRLLPPPARRRQPVRPGRTPPDAA